MHKIFPETHKMFVEIHKMFHKIYKKFCEMHKISRERLEKLNHLKYGKCFQNYAKCFQMFPEMHKPFPSSLSQTCDIFFITPLCPGLTRTV